MKQVIAIPLEEGRLCQHFGHCQQFAIIEAEEGTIVNEYLV
ncbi:MAG: ATPase, partial [Bacteroidales bacterium]|nr:ATPase [Bacteroidales bacterium]